MNYNKDELLNKLIDTGYAAIDNQGRMLRVCGSKKKLTTDYRKVTITTKEETEDNVLQYNRKHLIKRDFKIVEVMRVKSYFKWIKE